MSPIAASGPALQDLLAGNVQMADLHRPGACCRISRSAPCARWASRRSSAIQRCRMKAANRRDAAGLRRLVDQLHQRPRPGCRKRSLERLNREINAVLSDPDVRKRMEVVVFTPIVESQPALVQRIAQEQDKWKKVIERIRAWSGTACPGTDPGWIPVLRRRCSTKKPSAGPVLLNQIDGRLHRRIRRSCAWCRVHARPAPVSTAQSHASDRARSRRTNVGENCEACSVSASAALSSSARRRARSSGTRNDEESSRRHRGRRRFRCRVRRAPHPGRAEVALESQKRGAHVGDRRRLSTPPRRWRDLSIPSRRTSPDRAYGRRHRHGTASSSMPSRVAEQRLPHTRPPRRHMANDS